MYFESLAADCCPRFWQQSRFCPYLRRVPDDPVGRRDLPGRHILLKFWIQDDAHRVGVQSLVCEFSLQL